MIFTSGDNDIGGETLNDPVTRQKVDRFRQTFSGGAQTRVGQLDFVTFNVLEGQMLNETQKMERLQNLVPKKRPGDFRILVSHIPITASISGYV